VLDPIERTSELLFGVIMVLSFTGAISVAEGGHAETRTVLLAAIACNLAWGFVDAAMYLMANFAERARANATLRAVRTTKEDSVAHRLILAALPPVVSNVLTPSEVETVRQRLRQQPEPSWRVLTGPDFKGATGVFLLVFLSTFPIVAPFFFVPEPATALRASNGVAILMLFATGWSLGTHAGRPGWRTGLGMVAVGVALVAITMALGG
jgi:VIT1/CCC1 family predicted Fe2+/Mn2+ transporter